MSNKDKNTEVNNTEVNDTESRSLDEMMDALGQLIEKMESGEESLEGTFAMYEEGLRLVKECNLTIDRVEKDVLKLEEDGSVSVLQNRENDY